VTLLEVELGTQHVVLDGDSLRSRRMAHEEDRWRCTTLESGLDRHRQEKETKKLRTRQKFQRRVILCDEQNMSNSG
jgi:hypothetical protein